MKKVSKKMRERKKNQHQNRHKIEVKCIVTWRPILGCWHSIFSSCHFIFLSSFSFACCFFAIASTLLFKNPFYYLFDTMLDRRFVMIYTRHSHKFNVECSPPVCPKRIAESVCLKTTGRRDNMTWKRRREKNQ